jgi:hypothetical protein
MTDRYTKTILTVIALALVWISARDFIWPTPVSATQGQTMAVRVMGFSPNALGELSIFDSSNNGRRGVPVIIVNSLLPNPNLPTRGQ